LCQDSIPGARTLTSSGTLALSDINQVVTLNCASACTYTIPPHASIAAPVGATLVIKCTGAATATITQGAGVALKPTGSTTAQNVACNAGAQYPIRQDTTDAWDLYGLTVATIVPQGRLTLTSGQPVMTGNVTNSSTIYYDCSNAGRYFPNFSGSADIPIAIAACEVSDVVPTSSAGVANASDVFDIFGLADGSICHATNGSGGGWGSDTSGAITARGTGYSQLEMTRGYWTNKNAIAHCYNGSTDKGSIAADHATYLGSLYTTGAGQTSWQPQLAAASGGSNPCLCLYNAYNQKTATAVNIDNGAGYTYATGTVREQRASANNRVRFVDGLGQSSIDATLINGQSSLIQFAPSINSTAVFSFVYNSSWNKSYQSAVRASFLPVSGLNFVSANEIGSTGGTAEMVNTNALLVSLAD
jgi:hypothetical protein